LSSNIKTTDVEHVQELQEVQDRFQKMFDSAEADYDKRLQQSKDQYKKAFV
jgi:parvulin-like peptidyl-prolyl isomerase